jgi:hypothetical protein
MPKNMSDTPLKIEPSRMVDALISITPLVMQDVIQKARQYHTTILVADASGQLQELLPDSLEWHDSGNEDAQ